jgi:hypothetical protein
MKTLKGVLRLVGSLGCLSAVLLASVDARAQHVTLVNVIPNARSNETVNDAEPNLAINPANLFEVAVSAFTPNPTGGANAPIYVSNDLGRTWALNPILPGNNANYGTGDITLSFGGTSNVLYAAILSGLVPLQLNILRTPNFLGVAPMVPLVTRANDDQPWIDATTDVFGGARDRVFVGSNDISQRATGQTATIDRSLDAAATAAPAGFASIRLESRASAALPGGGRQDGPSVRTAIHSNGTVYAAYFGWRTFSNPKPPNTNTTDIVVVRDDGWAAGANPFTALIDPLDRLNGVRVARSVLVPSLGVQLGRQRIGSSLAIAVDPRQSRTVYLAWADGTTANAYTIHVRRSTDGGETWSEDLASATPATNPGLGVNETGTVAFFYQQLESGRWKTRVKLTDDGFATAKGILLADFEDRDCPAPCGAGPLGDYARILAIENTFYGVFSGWNLPDRANFPNGVQYQRNVDFAARTLVAGDNVTPVAQSVDPFFFTIEPADRGRGYQYAPKVVCGTQTDPLDRRLARGIYAATINITNPGLEPVRIAKTLALSFPPGGEEPGQTFPMESPLLGPAQTIAMDCNEVIGRLFNGVLPAAYIEGTLMIQSRQHIDVTGVYTVAPDAGTGSSSIAVQQFAPYRVKEPPAKPSPVVLRTGTFQLRHSRSVSLELDGVQSVSQGIDVRLGWSGSDVTLTPLNGAQIHVGGPQAMGKQGCQDAPLSDQVVTLDYEPLPNGTHICVRTSLGRIAELRLVSRVSTRMDFDYTVWQALP